MRSDSSHYLNLSPVLFFKWANTEGWPVLHVSENVYGMLGYEASAFLSQELSYQEIIFEEDMPRIIQEMGHHIKLRSPSFTHAPYRLIRSDGEHIWVEDTTYAIRNLYGEIDHFFGYITDITKLKEAEEERKKHLVSIENSNKELIKTINNLQSYKHVLDETNIVSMGDIDGNITYVNEAFLKTSGYTREEILGKPHSILRHPDTPKSTFKNMWDTILDKRIWKGFLKNRAKDGSSFYVNVTIAPLLDENRTIEKFISVRHNITDLMQKSDELKHQAMTDTLSGLGNRFKFLIDVKNCSKPCIALFDMAHFNEVNDFYGYEIGDKLIQEFGNALRSLAKEHCLVYRMYADQFVVLNDIDVNPHFEETMKKWHQHLQSTPLHVGAEEVHVDVVCVLSYEQTEELLTTADMAKNHAKDNHLLFYTYTKDSELSKTYERNLYWQKRLKSAFKDDAIVPYFQAISNVKTGKIEKYEALVRMVSDGEVVSPFQFLEIAKKTHQYAHITKVMIIKSFSLFANSTLRCSINLSVDDIKNADTMNFLWESIERYAMQRRVVLEIVESEGIENFDDICLFMQKAKEYGCKIAIDDFGTGYSNFYYLIKLQAHTIKIDGSIIKALEDEHSGASDVVEAIVTFAKARGMKTVAEFVSTQSIFEKIRALGIDFAQGYYIAQPLPKEALDLN